MQAAQFYGFTMRILSTTFSKFANNTTAEAKASKTPETHAATKNAVQSEPSGVYSQLEHLIKLRFDALQLNLSKPRIARNKMSGQYTSKMRGRGMDLAEVRGYQAGDDIRAIDWRVTARTQKTHTKVFQEERERPILIVLDQSSQMFFGSQVRFKSVLAAELASLVAWAAIGNGDRVGGFIFGDKQHCDLRPKRSKQQVLHLLNHIAEYNQNLNINHLSHTPVHLSDVLSQVRRVARPGSLIIIISDFSGYSEKAKSQLSTLSRHNDLVGLMTRDPMEQDLPLPGQYVLTDGTARINVNTANKRNRQFYKAQQQSHIESVQHSFQLLGGLFLQVNTPDVPLKALQTLFHRR